MPYLFHITIIFDLFIKIICIKSIYGLVWQLRGIIIAPNSTERWKLPKSTRKAWISFRHISGLVIHGGGQIDGQGAPWWNSYPDTEIKRPTVSTIGTVKLFIKLQKNLIK